MHVIKGDIVVWHREDRYGGPIEFEVIAVTPKRFTARATMRHLGEGRIGFWTESFRISDGRVIGNRHNMYCVRRKTDGCASINPGDAAMKLWDNAKANYDVCNQYALTLVLSLARRFPAVDGFQPMPDLYGKLSQIDNMTARLPDGFGLQNSAPIKDSQ